MKNEIKFNLKTKKKTYGSTKRVTITLILFGTL